MKACLKIPQSGIAVLPVLLMTVGIAAAGLVAWQVLASTGGASALTWVGLAGIVASLLAAGVVSMQGTANQMPADNDPPPEHLVAAEPPPAPVEVAAVVATPGPDPALTAALDAAQQQLDQSVAEREALSGELSVVQNRNAALIDAVQATADALARAREIVTAQAGGGSNAAPKERAASGVIANNSREVLDGIDSALATMQQQAAASAQRLVRVSESATETVELLSELIAYADQTEILSVNAAIQATLAGEAGNGFAVIAEQLQRLAGRSGDVCSRVETLSNLVSNDVSEAVSDNKERNAELARSKRLSGDLRTALNELTKASGDEVAAPGASLPPELLAALDAAGEKLSAALSAADEGDR